MTTVPGHNIVVQQSGAAQELTQQAHSPKPTPEQAAAQQEANEQVRNSTVQEFEESERIKSRNEKDSLKREQQRKKKEQEEKKKRQREKELLEMDPDATGKILDTKA